MRKCYNIASKFVQSNSIAQGCFIFLLCTLMTSANISLEKKIFYLWIRFPMDNLNWKRFFSFLVHLTIGSYVSCVSIEIWSTWALKSCSRHSLKQLLRIFHALQTSHVPHISMNARWCMNQLLNVPKKKKRFSVQVVHWKPYSQLVLFSVDGRMII